MRIAGWVLLVGGFLLCVSVTWAALGFLLMGVGLISLQVAERNRNRAKLAPVSRTESPAAQPEIPASPPETAQVSTGIAKPRPSRTDARYDKEAWRRLVESDSDLSRVTSVLQEYGQPYVDELARAYLAAGDKSRLPAIVDAIITMARKNAVAHTLVAPGVDRPSRTSPRPPRQTGDRTDPRYQRIPPRAPTVPVAPPPMPAEPTAVTAEIGPAEVQPADAPIAEVFVDPPAPAMESRNATITSADDALSELIGKFAPDSTFRRNN